MFNNTHHNITGKVVFLFVCLFFFLDSKAQCAMCRAVLESEAGQNAAQGINDGIIYLMAIPYILVAGIIYVIYRKYYSTGSKLNK